MIAVPMVRKIWDRELGRKINGKKDAVGTTYKVEAVRMNESCKKRNWREKIIDGSELWHLST